jgi:hypothetical protein
MRNVGLRTLGGLAFGVAVGTFGMPACKVESIFTCADDMACVAEAGEGAICDLGTNYCQVPDMGCVDLYHWYERSADEYAGKCLEDTIPQGTGSGGATGGSGSSGGGATGGESTAADSTPATDDGMTTAPDPSTTSGPGDSGGTDSTGAAGTCDAQFGAATDYLLCVETADTCQFSVTVNMAASCNDVCTMFGGSCAGADANEAELCTSTVVTTCDDATFGDGICTCNKM